MFLKNKYCLVLIGSIELHHHCDHLCNQILFLLLNFVSKRLFLFLNHYSKLKPQ